MTHYLLDQKEIETRIKKYEKNNGLIEKMYGLGLVIGILAAIADFFFKLQIPSFVYFVVGFLCYPLLFRDILAHIEYTNTRIDAVAHALNDLGQRKDS